MKTQWLVTLNTDEKPTAADVSRAIVASVKGSAVVQKIAIPGEKS